MTFVVTLTSVLVNFGVQPGFTSKWLHMWGMAFSIAYPVVLTIHTPIKKAVARVVK